AAKGPLTTGNRDLPTSTPPAPGPAGSLSSGGTPAGGPPSGGATHGTPPPTPPFWRKPKNLALILLSALLLAGGSGSALGYFLTFDIPEVTELQDWKPPVVTTITQQLARSLFLKPEKTMRRKLQEMVLAVQIEKAFTKQEILGFYCNQVYMGHGRYGIEAASEYYFGKAANKMTLPEAALLAGLVQRPETYSPFRSPEKARSRRDHVLNRMAEEDKISRDVADQGIATPVEVAKLP